ncbi:MAG TPA: hypothetical protein VJR58_08485, partial [Vineibacter sp.]|nr:hypothetical protein [Vineibacter sp.]
PVRASALARRPVLAVSAQVSAEASVPLARVPASARERPRVRVAWGPVSAVLSAPPAPARA